MTKHHSNGLIPALMTFALPTLSFFPLARFTHALDDALLLQAILNPLVWLVSLVLLAIPFAAVLIAFRRFKPFHHSTSHKDGEALDRIQKFLIEFPRRVLYGGLGSGIAIPLVLMLLVQGQTGRWLELLISAYANAVFFAMPCYILFLQRFEYWNRHIPFSTRHLSMKLGLRFNLVIGFVLSALSGALIVAFKNLVGTAVEPDQAWGQVVTVCLPITLVGLACGIVNMLLLMGGITDRIMRCKDFVLDMSSGDVSKDCMELSSRDELGALSQDLNLVHRNLNTLIGSTKHSVRKTLHVKNELLDVCSNTAQEVSRIGERVNQVEGQAQAVKDQVAQTLNRAKRFTEVIDDLNQGALQQAAMVDQTSGSITEMSAAIDNIARIADERMHNSRSLGEQTSEGEVKMRQTLDHLEKIAKSVEDIRGITGVIQGIAAQTNLLSMNAAIEAAHAGEAGRGFSVVADEIRKLANTSAHNSTEITARIKSIVSLIRETVEAGGETARTFRMVGSEMEGFLQSFREIGASMGEMRIGGQQILEASSALSIQSRAVKEKAAIMNDQASGLAADMDSLRLVADATMEAMHEVSDSVGAVNAAANKLKEHTRQLDKSTGEVAVHIGHFKVI